ncbi:hypothetical protein F5B19DRAFT_472646 [Rostrohypoxylon terebratum]|nr:hypothetical protein F5B19DRAFT_472646 [Rostrohypoxylon terebratum]
MSTSYFNNKRDQIYVQFKNARHNPDLMRDARAYLLNEENHQYQRRDSKNWPKPDTPFSDIREKQTTTIFVATDDVFLIGNQHSFSAGQYPGEPGTPGMSMVHLLAISRTNYFNPVLMGSSEARIFLDMIDFFKRHWDVPQFRGSVLEHQKKAVEKRGKTTQAGLSEARKQLEELEGTIHELKFEDFAFGFHLWPDNSVPHLHMHIIAMPEKYRRYSTRSHDEKTKNAYEVYDYIRDHQ